MTELLKLPQLMKLDLFLEMRMMTVSTGPHPVFASPLLKNQVLTSCGFILPGLRDPLGGRHETDLNSDCTHSAQQCSIHNVIHALRDSSLQH